jgi:hypothetical protein
VRQGNVMMPDLVLRSHRALASDLGSAFRFHTQLPQRVDVPEIRSDAELWMIECSWPSALLTFADHGSFSWLRESDRANIIPPR